MYSFYQALGSHLSADSVQSLTLTDTQRDWLIQRPLHLVGYALLAVVIRLVLHKLIERSTTRPAKMSAPKNLMSERRRQRAKTIGSVLKSAVSVVVLVWFLLSALAIFGINVTPFIASAGIVGLAFGFGAQNLVRDFLSGIFMLLEDQYGVGDIVDLGEASGTVETVGLRVTTVRDISGTLWYVRNGEVLRVGNMSQGHAVAVLDLPVAHSANIDDACRVAADTAESVLAAGDLGDDTLEAPQMLGVQAVTADVVTIRLTVKTRPGRQWAVQRHLHREILESFDDAGIAPPYPQGRPGGPNQVLANR